MLLVTLLVAMLLGTADGSPLNKRIPQRFAMAAFGDSFSAGIGAGRFAAGSADERDNVCARMTGSYPRHLQQMFPTQPSLDFLSCSGDVLDDIDTQVATLLGNNVDLATLSISGNDFNFGNVVKKCVYAKRTDTATQAGAQAACNTELEKAKNSVNDDSIFAKYRSKVQLIKGKLNDGGVLYITGYAKFFSPDGSSGDKCDGRSFFNSFWLDKLVGVLPMTISNRETMNDLVDQVNERIKTDVVAQLQNDLTLVFIDIDKHFDGHRFCEPGKDPWGSEDPRVQFNDLFTILDEEGKWDGPAHPDDLWAPQFDSIDEPGFAKYRGVGDLFQRNSVFHPKELAHTITAAQIFTDAATRIGQGFVKGPNQICVGTGPGGGDICTDVPDGCIGGQPIDNSQPNVVCPNGTIVSGGDLAPVDTNDNSAPIPLNGNSAGTNIHVNKGCIYINDSARCAGGDAYNVAFQNDQVSNATILAKIPSDPNSDTVTAGCQLEAVWPYYFGDIFYGEDDCLYDASGTSLQQCCSDSTNQQVKNPYI